MAIFGLSFGSGSGSILAFLEFVGSGEHLGVLDLGGTIGLGLSRAFPFPF